MRSGQPKQEISTEGPFRFIDLLDELGADGWELVTERTEDTVIFREMYGLHNVGSAVGIYYTFKRPVSD